MKNYDFPAKEVVYKELYSALERFHDSFLFENLENFSFSCTTTIPNLIKDGMLYPEPRIVRDFIQLLDKACKQTQSISDKSEESKLLQNAQAWVNINRRNNNLKELSYTDIDSFLKKIRVYLEDTYPLVARTGRHNRTQLQVCYFIAVYYEQSFKRRPTVSNYDTSNDSNNESEGTRYEVICRTFSRLYNLDIGWKTIKQAHNYPISENELPPNCRGIEEKYWVLPE